MSAIALFRKLPKTSIDSSDVELIFEEHDEEVVIAPRRDLSPAWTVPQSVHS
jgi:hypothetical protein